MFLSPFSKLSKSAEKKLTLFITVLLFIGIAIMRYFDGFIKNDVVKDGIVSFELAKTLTISTQMIHSWDEVALHYVSLSLWIDFLFLFIYSLFFALMIHKLNERVWKETVLYKTGIIILWMQFVAAFADVIENIGLLQLINRNTQQIWSSVAYYFASIKFVLLFVGLGFIVVSLLVWVFMRFLRKHGR